MFVVRGDLSIIKIFKCYQNCKTCTGEQSNECTSCKIGFMLDGTQCLPCHHTCATCSGVSNTECLSCLGNLLYDSLTKTCLNSCPDGKYFD